MEDVRRSELKKPCVLCKKIKVGQMGEVMCCGEQSCGGEHMWCKECWMMIFAFLSACPLLEKEYKERRFHSEKTFFYSERKQRRRSR